MPTSNHQAPAPGSGREARPASWADGFVEQVEKTIVKRGLFQPGEAILVAVSGGVDSMVLLDVLHRLAPRQGWKLAVAHFNHQLRGRSSDADERLVLGRAADLKLPAVAKSGDVRVFARKHHLSLELAARKLRHEFLAQTATDHQCQRVALAHHADDQLELFFLRLLRGSGTEGLGGMRWSNPSPAGAKVQLSRPLLDQPKNALYRYAEARRLKFREDASNALVDIQRNRIRHELLPLLRSQYQPALDKTVLRLMDLLARESEVVRAAALDWLQASPGRRGPFERLPVAVQRRCLHLQLVELGLQPEFELVERLRVEVGGLVCISSGRVLRDAEGMVRLQPLALSSFKPETVDLALQGRAGELEFSGVRIGWQKGRKGAQIGLGRRLEGQEAFDAEAVGPRVRLRHWRPGDRFQPLGMGSGVKLQDLFINGKVPRARRHGLIVAEAANGEIFWVEGLRIGERFKLTPQTIRRLHWRWQRL